MGFSPSQIGKKISVPTFNKSRENGEVKGERDTKHHGNLWYRQGNPSCPPQE